MNFRDRKVKIKYAKEAILCIVFGTLVGLGVYGFFLYFNIAIFGWNLGLLFAPLVAGYAETLLANRIIGESIGAISAFILFIYTVVYSFILNNPTLGFNIITIGSIAVILQSAFPTLINYILIVGGLGVLSYFLGIFKRITNFFSKKIRHIRYKHGRVESEKIEVQELPTYNEHESNKKLNKLDFCFYTSNEIRNKKHAILGHFHTTVVVEKDKRLVHSDQQKVEEITLINLKKGKDECLLKLAEDIMEIGGNAITNLEIQYGLIGLGGDSYQITAMGMGIYLKEQ